MSIMKTAQIILTLLPVISNVVKDVEALNATPGAGKEKLTLALTIIRSIYESSSPVESFDNLAGKVTEIITALVTFYNKVGAFVKAVKAA